MAETIRITWTDSVTPEVIGHKVYRDDVQIADVGLGVESYDDITAEVGVQYKYEVQAYSPQVETEVEVEGTNMDYITLSIEVTVIPTLTNFRIDNANKTRVYFDTPSGYPDGMTESGVYISNNTVTGMIKVDDNGGYFSVSTAFDFWDTSQISYDGSQGLVLPFTLSEIINNIDEPVIYAKTMYVAMAVDGGSDSNSGTSIGSPYLTLQKALQETVSNGNIIHVKAGLYSGEAISSSNNGTNGTVISPTVVQGYKTTPGDLNGVMYYNYGDTLDQAEMPLFDGGTRTSTFLDLAGSQYKIIRNIQIVDYTRGLWSQNNTTRRGMMYDNCLAYNDYSISIPSGGGSGVGFAMESTTKVISDCIIRDCIAVNHPKSGFSILGITDSLIKGNKSYCNEVGPENDVGVTTDYYYEIASDRCTIVKNLAHKDTEIDGTTGNNGHAGHGIAMKGSYVVGGGPVEYNLIEGNEIINVRGAIELRWDQVAYNVVKNNLCRANVSNRYISGSYEYTGGVHILEGAHNNIVERNIVHDVDSFIYYGEFGEISGNTSIRDNVIRNNVAYNLINVISATNWEGGTSTNTNEKYYNNTFKDCDYFSRLTSDVSMVGFDFKNNIIDNITTEYKDQSTGGFAFDYTNIVSSWTGSLGTNSSSHDPQYSPFPTPSNQSLIAAPYIEGVNDDLSGKERDGVTTTIGCKAIETVTTPPTPPTPPTPSDDAWPQDDASSVADLNSLGSWSNDGDGNMSVSTDTDGSSTYSIYTSANDTGYERISKSFTVEAGNYNLKYKYKSGQGSKQRLLVDGWVTYFPTLTEKVWTTVETGFSPASAGTITITLYAIVDGAGAIGDEVWLDEVQFIKEA